MFKKTKLTKTLVAAGICCLSSIAFAGGPDMPSHDLYSGGWGLGLSWNSSDHLNGNGYGIRGSYTTDRLTASLITQLTHIDFDAPGVSSRWEWGLIGELGFRDRLGMENLFLKYGAGAGVTVISNKPAANQTPWYVGPFVGLDYQPLRNFMISGSIYPVSYKRDFFDDKYWGFFDEGNVALSYIF